MHRAGAGLERHRAELIGDGRGLHAARPLPVGSGRWGGGEAAHGSCCGWGRGTCGVLAGYRAVRGEGGGGRATAAASASGAQ